ncbi:MAG TPA: hypothetical protein VHD83_10020 [Puia sp.]|nr:hypothetical protein [Puia sp.]
MEKEIKAKTVALRKNNKIKLPDAIIAATAIVNGLTLLTRNVADFQNISDLSFINDRFFLECSVVALSVCHFTKLRFLHLNLVSVKVGQDHPAKKRLG